MSAKRQATSELNHENWNDEEEKVEMGMFKTASKEDLEKRVIKTARRRTQMASGDEAKKSVFSNFGGFKAATPASSFNFLANLTGENKSDSPAKSEPSSLPGIFNSKPASSPGGLFGTAAASTTNKPAFGSPTSQVSTLFSSSPATPSTSLFSAPKGDSKVSESPFKIQGSNTETPKTEAPKSVNTSPFLNSAPPSAVFNKSPLGKPAESSLFKSQSNAFTSKPPDTFKPISNGKESDNKPQEKTDEKKLKYYSKLKGLNESVLDWIKKHVEETPLCILSPIFKDYEKYVKEIQEEYQGPGTEDPTNEHNEKKIQDPKKSSLFDTKNNAVAATNNAGFSFGIKPTSTSTAPASTGFSFGSNAAAPTSSAATTSPGFSFGINTTASSGTATTSSPFSFTSNTTTTNGTNGATPFSFGTNKPFSFSPNVQQKPAEKSTEAEEKEEEDEPPKVEFTPVVEDNCVFEKRCKIFVKKDGNFTDKGIGTLYIKKIEESGKHQLLVRANTNLGNVLMNLVLSSSIPIQRMGKNNVMMACIPTPDAEPPPTPVLIRVKTSDEADNLLETLNKYKE